MQYQPRSALAVLGVLILGGCADFRVQPLDGPIVVASRAPKTAPLFASSTGRRTDGMPLVVISYGNGSPADSSGHGLRDIADEIRRRYPGQEVITRGWDDEDSILLTLQRHRGPIMLVGHSYGGSRSVELASRLGRTVDCLILLDPVVQGHFGFAPPGRFFQIPDSVNHAICYYRPLGGWPASFPILNPRHATDNRPRNIEHNEFCSSAEVRRSILDWVGANAASGVALATGTQGDP